MGDEPWMPCGSTELNDDWDMFEPKPRTPVQQSNKKRKRDFENEISQNGTNGHDYTRAEENGGIVLPVVDRSDARPEVQDERQSKNTGQAEEVPETTDEPPAKGDVPDDNPPATNGVHKDEKTPMSKPDTQQASDEKGAEESKEHSGEMDVDTEELEDEAASEDETQPQPTRRITRALAAEHNSSNAPTPPPHSPHSTASSIDSSLLHPDPLFLLPPILAANHRPPRSLARIGLPADELIETRRLLMMYIQKQEESVRGYEGVLGKLIKAKRMRDHVWEWCKTEGHVGEWSDGEDWIDAEAWGLAPEELKKGKDEEEVEGQEDTGRKGKRRRRD